MVRFLWSTLSTRPVNWRFVLSRDFADALAKLVAPSASKIAIENRRTGLLTNRFIYRYLPGSSANTWTPALQYKVNFSD
jgi:hypothetical protein